MRTPLILCVITIFSFAPACAGDDADDTAGTDEATGSQGSDDSSEDNACGEQDACPDDLFCEDGLCVSEAACTGESPTDCCCHDGLDLGWTCGGGQWLCSGMYELNGDACSDPCGPCFHPYNCPENREPDPCYRLEGESTDAIEVTNVCLCEIHQDALSFMEYLGIQVGGRPDGEIEAPDATGFSNTLWYDQREVDGDLAEFLWNEMGEDGPLAAPMLYLRITGSGHAGPDTVGPFWYGPWDMSPSCSPRGWEWDDG